MSDLLNSLVCENAEFESHKGRKFSRASVFRILMEGYSEPECFIMNIKFD